MRMVLDASVALSWCFPDEAGEHAQRILELQRNGGAVVPTIWPLEIANALIVAERKKRIEASEAVSFFSLLLELGFRVDTATPNQAFGDIHSLARAHGLSAYDASYLELAIREGLPLATSDDALKRAARKSGVALDRGADPSHLVEPEAQALVKAVARYPEVLQAAAEANEPSELANYLLEVAHALHASYNVLRVKDAPAGPAAARLLLYTAVRGVLAGGLEILGIKPLERM